MRRLRFAVLSEGFIFGYSRLLFKGIDQAARDLNIDLVCITCAALASVNTEMRIRNILYEHIDPTLYDGFVIPYSSLSSYAGDERFQEKLKEVLAKPCIIIGGKIPGHPSLMPGWEDGVRELIAHLVEEHSCKKFLFVRGPEKHIMSNTREVGFIQGLKDHNIDPSTLDTVNLAFYQEEGEKLAKELVEQDRLKDYDALVFVSDSVGGAALKALLALGVNVPEDIIVCACTNAPTGKLVHPYLTTLDENVDVNGYHAVQLLKDHVEGKAKAKEHAHKVKFIVRESCGCKGKIQKLDELTESMAMLDYFQLFRQLGFSLLTDNRLSEVFPLLNKAIGTKYCSISLFEQGQFPFPESRSLAVYKKGEAVFYGEKGPLFKTSRFVPGEIFCEERRSILVEPMYYRDHYLGLLCIESGPHNGIVYEVVLAQFASAIYLSLQHSRLQTAEKRFYDMAFTSSDWLWEIDAAGNITYSSGALVEMLGLKPEELVGSDFFSNLLPIVSGQLDELKRKMLVSREFIRNQEVLSKNSDGTPIFFQLSGKPAWDENGQFTGYRGACKDITHSKRMEEQVRFMAYNDMLTGLPNRRLFIDRLETEFKKARREKRSFTLMFTDLDNFKAINDTLGHEKGDELLKEVASCLSMCVRGSDTLARVGGDEFVFLLPPVQNRDSASIVAERIMNNFRQRFANDPDFSSIGASIGIAQYPTDGTDLDTLIHNADLAMYKAKSAGKGGYCFYSHDNTEQEKQKRSRKSAVNNQLLPIFNAKEGSVIGFFSKTEVQDSGKGLKFALSSVSSEDELHCMHEQSIHLTKLTSDIDRWNKNYNKRLFCVFRASARILSNTELFTAFLESLQGMPLEKNLIYIAVSPEISFSDIEHISSALELLAGQGYQLMLSGCTASSIPLSLLEKISFSLFGFNASDAERADQNKRFAMISRLISETAKASGAKLIVEQMQNTMTMQYFSALGFDGWTSSWQKQQIKTQDAERLLLKSGVTPETDMKQL